jgi:hypothetical protein
LRVLPVPADTLVVLSWREALPGEVQGPVSRLGGPSHLLMKGVAEMAVHVISTIMYLQAILPPIHAWANPRRREPWSGMK